MCKTEANSVLSDHSMQPICHLTAGSFSSAGIMGITILSSAVSYLAAPFLLIRSQVLKSNYAHLLVPVMGL